MKGKSGGALYDKALWDFALVNGPSGKLNRKIRSLGVDKFHAWAVLPGAGRLVQPGTPALLN